MKLGKLVSVAALGLPVVCGQAKASAAIDITQVGGDVVATASGAIDLTGLTHIGSGFLVGAVVWPSFAVVSGGASYADIDSYGGVSGPTSFGPGGRTLANGGSGDPFGLDASYAIPYLSVPKGYMSGSPLSGSSTFDGQTLASLGLTPGTYVYTWGAPADDGSLTVKIAIPEPATWAMILLGFAGLGFAGYRAARKSAAVTARIRDDETGASSSDLCVFGRAFS
jgi:hypothetical protein